MTAENVPLWKMIKQFHALSLWTLERTTKISVRFLNKLSKSAVQIGSGALAQWPWAVVASGGQWPVGTCPRILHILSAGMALPYLPTFSIFIV